MKNKCIILLFIANVLLVLPQIGNTQSLIQSQPVSYDKPIDSALVQIARLQPQQFICKDKGLVTKNNYGFEVNEFEKVFPFMVSTRNQVIKPGNFPKSNFPKTLTIKNVDYVSLVPVLVAAMQEQQAMILKQQQQIDALYKMLYTK